jgi:hypothetical protein
MVRLLVYLYFAPQFFVIFGSVVPPFKYSIPYSINRNALPRKAAISALVT